MEQDGYLIEKVGYISLYGPSYRTKYTVSDQGQQNYVGWTKAGKARYMELMAMCKEARASAEGLAVERAFLAKLQAELGIKVGQEKAKKRAARAQDHESDVEEDDSGFDMVD